VVVEDGSELVAELWESRQPAASSVLAYPEGRAALAQARRAGRLTAPAHARALNDFDDVHRELLIVGVDEPLARRAGELADDLGLRGYDAMHLASALALQRDTVTVVTWDQDLHRAAALSGCAVAPA